MVIVIRGLGMYPGIRSPIPGSSPSNPARRQVVIGETSDED